MHHTNRFLSGVVAVALLATALSTFAGASESEKASDRRDPAAATESTGKESRPSEPDLSKIEGLPELKPLRQ